MREDERGCSTHKEEGIRVANFQRGNTGQLGRNLSVSKPTRKAIHSWSQNPLVISSTSIYGLLPVDRLSYVLRAATGPPLNDIGLP